MAKAKSNPRPKIDTERVEPPAPTGLDAFLRDPKFVRMIQNSAKAVVARDMDSGAHGSTVRFEAVEAIDADDVFHAASAVFEEEAKASRPNVEPDPNADPSVAAAATPQSVKSWGTSVWDFLKNNVSTETKQKIVQKLLDLIGIG